MAVIGPMIPSLAQQTQSSLALLGYLFIAGSAGYLIGSSFAGRIFDHLPGHPILGIVQIVAGVCLALMPFTQQFWGLFGLMLVKGIAQGMVNTGSNTLLVWTHGIRVGPYMNALHFFFGLGAFISPILVAQAFSFAIAYQWVFISLAIFCMLVGLRIILLGGSPPPAQHAPTGDASQLSPAVVLFIASTALFLFFYVGAELAYGGWIYTYIVQLNLAEPAAAAYVNSGFWLFFTIGRLISIPLAVRLKPKDVILTALVCAIGFISLLLFFPVSLTSLWIATVGIGICMAPIFPTGVTLAGNSLKLTAKISGLIFLGDSLGGMILPWLVGQVIEGAGPQILMILISISLAGTFAAYFGMLRAQKSLAHRN